ncbi:bifunctional sugar phosphate isomerase/epimerase/4-hydroxyphenylpyruvate dioxygenase family protein [Microbacterium sp. cx-59]|uniref:bifunctional sugar phosphate isomerase/epimerase/4-hydroxyphenylpyruvate dioxygenase family protein n=1 Tax=Microbacterium sp. cx-59 TaxID=2891207 RepID=UPI001E3F4782|nr:sugar phosphate isomerase/epimerase and 4-hydroxyphenylpyruvate domain-containing protein [Microbacterium sp. cx-59]MCC4907357.1 sugar phosphate isomerase/epimerase and 4-hydroxyphenylpyruvate domain-containing protein [Microbacterium sp. cx-59]
MKTSIATVCLSGTLADKLRACAAAGFDGIEIFEPDLVAAPESPSELRASAERLGLSIDLYQPMRDVEGVDEPAFLEVLRRAEAKFTLMRELGVETVLCCSNVGTATIDDDDVSASQLRRLGDLAARYGVRIAYEALAWGRFVDDYRRAWRIVQLADHPAVGVCIDSFHILSRGHDPAAIEQIPGEKIFFLQLADAPTLSMDVLSWSRHHRLFPGEGSFDLVDLMTHVVRAGYTGPWSLEVFNDTFRQTDAERTAVHARRSLRHLEDAVARRLGDDAPGGLALLTDTTPPVEIDFVEIKAEDTSAVEALLAQAGFTSRGRHRTKPVTLWTSGRARVVLNEQHARGLAPHIAAIGVAVQDAEALTRRADELATPRAYRRTYAAEQPLDAAVAPDGTELYWADATSGEPAWVGEFEHGASAVSGAVEGVDHVSLTLPWQVIEESVLFYRSVLGLRVTGTTDVPGPQGLMRSRVMSSADRAVRLPLNVAPPMTVERGHSVGLAQHVAFACGDVRALAAAAAARGLEFLRMPDNYYDDLAARFDLSPERVQELRSLRLAYDRDDDAEYLHCYTRTVGEVFLEFVERRRGYDGFGAGAAPVRLAAQGAMTASAGSVRS